MPQRSFNVVRARPSGIVQIYGSFLTNGGSSPVSQTGIGFQTVVRAATGNYTITLGRTPTAGAVEFDTYFALVGAEVNMQQNAASVTGLAVLGPVSVGPGISPQTITIFTLNSTTGAAADVAAGANSAVWFTFDLLLSNKLNNN